MKKILYISNNNLNNVKSLFLDGNIQELYYIATKTETLLLFRQ
jgi:hypothetical protein